MAATFLGGTGSLVSHRSAAALLHIRMGTDQRVEVTTTHRIGRGTSGVGFHRTLEPLPADERAEVDGMPVTSAARTVFDLAAVVSGRAVERALAELEIRRLYGPLSVSDLVARYPRRPGTPLLRSLLAQDAWAATRSELEERFMELVAGAALPRPRTNVMIATDQVSYEVDCAWDDVRLVVELDGRRFHEVRVAFEADRARDRALAVAGWRVVRITWRELADRPESVIADLRALLGESRVALAGR